VCLDAASLQILRTAGKHRKGAENTVNRAFLTGKTVSEVALVTMQTLSRRFRIVATRLPTSSVNVYAGWPHFGSRLLKTCNDAIRGGTFLPWRLNFQLGAPALP
jgi:hypothetical protein